MVLGCYYLTANNPTEQILKDQYFASFDDVITAYKQDVLHLHTFVWVRYKPVNINECSLLTNSNFVEKQVGNRIICIAPECQIKKDLDGNVLQIYLKTTPGRILLNQSFED